MPYIPPEVVVRAREMDLLTYLRTYEPQELVHFGGNTYCTREHDSLKISNGKWCWFSRGIGGYSALDYLIKVKEMPFTQAVETIMGNLSAAPPAFVPAPKAPKEKVLLLPQANRCATHAVEYLHRRGIGYELIDFCIQTGRLYESYPYHNVVFVGMDEAGSGALQGHALAEYFWETDHGTDIRYLLFQGMPGQENTDARSGTAVQSLLDDGFCPIAAADYQVCGFSRERARQAMAALLEQGVDFDCVICDNDEMALGVIEALEAAGWDPGAAPIVSVDHTAEGAAALESGKLYMTVDQNPEAQARAAVAAAVNLARGRAYDDGLRELLGNDCTDPEQPFVLRVPVEAVTA